MGQHWKELINPAYLGAYSLWDEKTSKFVNKTVKIKSIKKEVIRGNDRDKDKEISKAVMQLHNDKPMVLNSTNMQILEKLFRTPDVSLWYDKEIILTTEKVDAFGKSGVDVLRVFPKLAKLPEITPEHPRWKGAKAAILNGNSTIEKLKAIFSISKENEELICKA